MKHADFIFLDLLCLNISFILAVLVRFYGPDEYDNDAYITLAAIYSLVDLLVMILNSAYKNVLKRGLYKELVATVKHVLLVELIVSFFLMSIKESETYSRIFLYLMPAIYLVLCYCMRLSWKRFIRKRGTFMKKSALYFITTSDRAEAVVTNVLKKSMGEYIVQGMCVLDQDCVGQTIAGVPVTSNQDTILDYLCDKWQDEVFVSIPTNYPYPAKMLSSLAEMGIVVHVEMEDLVDTEWQHQVIEQIAGRTVRTISISMATTKQAIFKRTLDIIGGLVGCFITILLTIIFGPLIYIQSPGPIFFSQIRVGKNGKKFKMYKFRSMYLDAEERKAELMAQNRVGSGLMFKLDYDPRIIGCKKNPDGTIKKGIGNFIRDYSIDEFPQFFNVLKGDLSLVGTRPPTVDEWEQYKLHHRARLAIKPGITGMWQVSGRSDITDFEQVVELDKKYIREWDMGMDLRILLQTVKVVLSKKGSM